MISMESQQNIFKALSLENHPITAAAVVAGSLAEAAYQGEEGQIPESAHQEEASQAEMVVADQACQGVELPLVVVDPSSFEEEEP